jgi:hypothetical protein
VPPGKEPSDREDHNDRHQQAEGDEGAIQEGISRWFDATNICLTVGSVTA